MVKEKSKLQIIEDDIKQRNTIAKSEFKKFAVLYQENGIELIGEDNYNELSKVFESRFSLRNDIVVLTDDRNEVLITLSPIFRNLPTLNECDKATMTDVFLNGLDRKYNNPTDILAAKTSNTMIDTLANNIKEEVPIKQKTSDSKEPSNYSDEIPWQAL